jgi:hypothetical protein
VDAKIEPITGDEIFFVLRKRLLPEPPPEEVANRVADIYYVDTIKRNMLSYATSEIEQHEIEERIIKYRERFVLAYPFHPGLIDLMHEKMGINTRFSANKGCINGFLLLY